MKDKIIIAISNITMLTHEGYGWLRYENGKYFLKDEIEDFFYTISWEGANATRILPYSPFVNTFPKKEMFQPYKWDSKKNKWDLEQFNDEYFSILKKVIKLANKYGLKVWFSLFDNCQFFKGAREYSPWANNIQGLSSYMDSLALSKKWVNRVVKELKELDVAYEVGNELSPKIGIEAATFWAVEIIKQLKELNINPLDINYGALMELCKDYENNNCKLSFLDKIKGKVDMVFGEEWKLSIFKPVHNIYSNKNAQYLYGQYLQQALYWWGGAKPIRVWFSDDGTFDGDKADNCDKDLGAPIPEIRPSHREWGKIFEYIITRKKIGQTYLPRIAIEHLPANIKDFSCIKKTVAVISDKYKKFFGEYPTNYRKDHEPEPEPEPNPKPIPPEEEDSIMKKIINWLFGENSLYQKNPKRLFWITLALLVIIIILCI